MARLCQLHKKALYFHWNQYERWSTRDDMVEQSREASKPFLVGCYPQPKRVREVRTKNRGAVGGRSLALKKGYPDEQKPATER